MNKEKKSKKKVCPHYIIKPILILLSLIILSSILYLVGNRNLKEIKKEKLNKFNWKHRLTAPKLKKLNSAVKQNRYKETNMDLTIIPQKEDTILYSCDFYIEIGYCYGEEETIYFGPFKKHIILKSVSYLGSSAEITFIAYNEQTKVYYSWKSKRYHEIFINKPLLIELYDGYNNEADAWFKIYTKNIH